MNNPFLSVIVPVYNGNKYIGTCLESIFNQSYPRQDYEVIVVDNGSNDSGMEIARQYDAKIITEEKKGSYAARNAGIKEARGELLAFIDIDCIAASDWLEHAVNYLASKPGIDLLSGHIIFLPPESITIWGYFDMFGFLRQEHQARMGRSLTANLFIWKRVFRETGLFSDNLISGGDVEWTGKATGRGYKLDYNSQVRVYHPVRNCYPQVSQKCFRVGYGVGQMAGYSGGCWSLLRPTHLKIPLRSYYTEVLKQDNLFRRIIPALKMVSASLLLQSAFYEGKGKGCLAAKKELERYTNHST